MTPTVFTVFTNTRADDSKSGLSTYRSKVTAPGLVKRYAAGSGLMSAPSGWTRPPREAARTARVSRHPRTSQGAGTQSDSPSPGWNPVPSVELIVPPGATLDDRLSKGRHVGSSPQAPGSELSPPTVNSSAHPRNTSTRCHSTNSRSGASTTLRGPRIPLPRNPTNRLAAGLLPRTLPDTNTRNPPPFPSSPIAPRSSAL